NPIAATAKSIAKSFDLSFIVILFWVCQLTDCKDNNNWQKNSITKNEILPQFLLTVNRYSH
ncbi:MAG: hypothetical protein SO082_01245, partial [Candidatus Limisoma sp.]|nr:hypothetical protein [Candidatus Limisoma sp.]